MVSAPPRKTHVKKGDNVTVISGNHRGKTGKVLRVIAKKNQVLVEGVRMTKKHTKKSQDRPQGGILEQEGPIHISNVALSSKFKKGSNKTSTNKSATPSNSTKRSVASKEPKTSKAKAKKESEVA